MDGSTLSAAASEADLAVTAPGLRAWPDGGTARVVDDGGVLRFAEPICIDDSTIVPTSLVYPV